MSIEVNGENTREGLTLLRDFMASIRMARRWREAASKGLLELVVGRDFLIHTTAWTATRSNIVDLWFAYRERLASWLGEFVDKYGIDAPLKGLPIDYVARASLLTLLTLARDLAEVRYYSLTGEARDIITSPIGGTGLTLYDTARFVYPAAVFLGHTDEEVGYAVAAVKVDAVKGARASPVEVPVGVYLTGAVGGILAEDVVGRLMGGRKRVFGITGLGSAWHKLSMYTARHSMMVPFYKTVIASMLAISRIHQELLSGAINGVLELDPYGYVDRMLSMYMDYGSQYKPYFPRLYDSAYTSMDALTDLAAMVFTLISLKAALSGEPLAALLRKYKFLLAPAGELVKSAVKTLLYTSGGAT
jgi:hypothetical protein